MFGDTNGNNQTAAGSDPAVAGGAFGATPTGPVPASPPQDASGAAMTPEMSTLNSLAPPSGDATGMQLPPAQPSSAPDVPDTPGVAVADPTMSSNYVDAIAATPAQTPDPSLADPGAASVPLPDVGAAASTGAAPGSLPTDQMAVPPMTEEASHALSEIKQDALQQLSPLVDHLEQTPEEKFRTTMMMLQATDNHDLVKTAYEAAQSIADEKARARALLDVVNEINYFHQQEKQQ